MTSEEKFALLESKLSTFAQRAESQATLIDDLRFQQEQLAAHSSSALSPIWHLIHAMIALARQTARSGPAFWLLLPVTGPRAALEYIVEGLPSTDSAHGHRIREKAESSESGSFTSGETSDESPVLGRAQHGKGTRARGIASRSVKSGHTLR